ncbi:glucosaminyltransferase [Dictyobacter sp. S3.2.2.5]|uniref:Glucosaminyltransferase n=2 Tax=Dictyobacter halimunensis TaxID=3026934 RepID=A0ABQ6G086_9CHLR|nr:glucosaminyltransferase [Dictyobacter sp. S3.2.2.5]
MILAPWYSYDVWAKRRRYFARRNYRPLVSVIIPAWNEEVGLVSTLKTILASSYRPLEIVVVNDGSTDNSDSIMRAFIQRYQRSVQGSRNYANVIYHYQPNGGKGTALNTGISLAHGEIIITFDADSVVHEEAVEHFVSYFADPEVMAAAGNIMIGNTKTILGFIQSIEYFLGFQIKKAESLLGVVFVIGGAASAFRKEVFTRLGGYDTGTLTEDLDLSLRIQEAGMRIVYVPEAIVHTEGPTTLAGLRKQRLRWKRGRLEAFRMHRSSFFRTKGANKAFFWVILPMVIFGDIEIVLGSMYVLLLYLYSLLNHDFTLLLLTIVISTITFSLQLSEDRYFRKLSNFILAPLFWFFLHLATFVELDSLIKALYTYYRKHEVKWQKWQRTGVADS